MLKLIATYDCTIEGCDYTIEAYDCTIEAYDRKCVSETEDSFIMWWKSSFWEQRYEIFSTLSRVYALFLMESQRYFVFLYERTKQDILGRSTC